eukprot:1827384-Rhodomonas_salina.1
MASTSPLPLVQGECPAHARCRVVIETESSTGLCTLFQAVTGGATGLEGAPGTLNERRRAAPLHSPPTMYRTDNAHRAGCAATTLAFGRMEVAGNSSGSVGYFPPPPGRTLTTEGSCRNCTPLPKHCMAMAGVSQKRTEGEQDSWRRSVLWRWHLCPASAAGGQRGRVACRLVRPLAFSPSQGAMLVGGSKTPVVPHALVGISMVSPDQGGLDKALAVARTPNELPPADDH